jgi:hypothetical protein
VLLAVLLYCCTALCCAAPAYGQSSAADRPQAQPGSSSSGSNDGSSAGSALRRGPPRVRRNAGGPKQLPPLQVLPKDVELPVTHQNPRQNPAAAGPDADLAYD